MKEIWFPLTKAFFVAAIPVSGLVFAYLRWRRPEEQYAGDSECKKHVIHICILYVILLGVLAGVASGLVYLATSEVTIKRPIVRIKPKDVSIEVKRIPYEGQEVLVTDHARWLVEEAERERQSKVISDYNVVEVYHEAAFATPDFNWIISSSPGYLFSVRGAYRLISAPRRVLEVVEVEKKTPDSAIIKVPPLNKSDLMVVMLKVAAARGNLPDDVRRVLSSRVE